MSSQLSSGTRYMPTRPPRARTASMTSVNGVGVSGSMRSITSGSTTYMPVFVKKSMRGFSRIAVTAFVPSVSTTP